jgi:hypothetical protein
VVLAPSTFAIARRVVGQATFNFTARNVSGNDSAGEFFLWELVWTVAASKTSRQ